MQKGHCLCGNVQYEFDETINNFHIDININSNDINRLLTCKYLRFPPLATFNFRCCKIKILSDSCDAFAEPKIDEIDKPSSSSSLKQAKTIY